MGLRVPNKYIFYRWTNESLSHTADDGHFPPVNEMADQDPPTAKMGQKFQQTRWD